MELSSVSTSQWADIAVKWMPRSLMMHIKQEISMRKNENFGISESGDHYEINIYFDGAQRCVSGITSLDNANLTVATCHYVSLMGEIKAPMLYDDEPEGWKPDIEQSDLLKLLLPSNMPELLDIYSCGQINESTVISQWIQSKNDLLAKIERWKNE
jgi:hypothetical protein